MEEILTGINSIMPRRSSIAGALTRLSPRFREWLFFQEGLRGEILQKVLQRVIGGPRRTHIQYTSGLLEGLGFECLTSERYFVMGEDYEYELQQRLVRIVSPNSVVYDIGAHAGFWSLWFARAVRGGSVLAFEPSPLNFRRLKANIERNSSVRNIDLFNGAVSEKEGRALLREAGSFSAIEAESAHSNGTVVWVQTICLDEFVYRDLHPCPTLVKLDVEGYAGSCMKGMDQLIKKEGPRFVIELHSYREERDVLNWLEGAGYEIEPVEPGRSFPIHIIATSMKLLG